MNQATEAHASTKKSASWADRIQIFLSAEQMKSNVAEWRSALMRLCDQIDTVNRWQRWVILLAFLGFAGYGVYRQIVTRDFTWLRSPFAWAFIALLVYCIGGGFYQRWRWRRLSEEQRAWLRAKQAQPNVPRRAALWAAEVASRLAGGEIDGNEMRPYLRWYSRWAVPALRRPTLVQP
jgi:hypothetical protein